MYFLVSYLCLKVHMSIAEHEKNEIKIKIKNGKKGHRQYANADPSKEREPEARGDADGFLGLRRRRYRVVFILLVLLT